MRMAKNADGCLARETNVLIFLMHFTLGFTILSSGYHSSIQHELKNFLFN